MDVILFLQALEPRSVVRLVFAAISWCGDGPLYLLLFPLLYWGKAPAVAVRYGYLWGWAVLVMVVLKGHWTILRPFLAAPEQVAFLPPLLAGFYWFPSQDLLVAAYRQSPTFPSGHALVATAVGLYLATLTPSVGWRCLLGGGQKRAHRGGRAFEHDHHQDRPPPQIPIAYSHGRRFPPI